MGLDIRLPIGLMFSIIGALLTVYGLIEPDQSQSLGTNVNLVWGACILVFGVVMLGSWKLLPQKPSSSPPADPGDRPRGGH